MLCNNLRHNGRDAQDDEPGLYAWEFLLDDGHSNFDMRAYNT